MVTKPGIYFAVAFFLTSSTANAELSVISDGETFTVLANTIPVQHKNNNNKFNSLNTFFLISPNV